MLEPSKKRKTEIRELLKLSPEEIIRRAGDHLVVCEDLDALHQKFARDIANAIQIQQLASLPSRFILPVGPIGQYRYLLEIIKEEEISVKNCWFFFMDEYCGEDGKAVPASHPLSFRGTAQREFLEPLSKITTLKRDQVFFPNEDNINTLVSRIEELGGLDACFGGIGIHGHVAFNEPEPNIKVSGPRKVHLNDFTITINAIRARVGGNLETFPRYAYTLGMTQILSARKIFLYCRNGTPYDWANTVLRLALFGQPGDDYPVTYIRNHNYIITTDKDTLTTPEQLI